MSKVEVTDTIPAPLDRVWAIVGSFTGLMDALGTPYESWGEGIGMTRTISAFGPPITERFEALDEDNHITSYSIVESSLPIENYQAWIEVADEGNETTTIRWWSQFEPTGDEEQIVTMIRGIYEGGIAGLKKALAQ